MAIPRELLLVVPTLGAALFASPGAFAIGPIPPGCGHILPKGAAYHAETGDVTLDGERVANYRGCSAEPDGAGQASPPVASSGSHGGLGASTTNWYSFSWANAIPISGFQGFNAVQVSWTVPDPGPDDSTVLYLFPSLENFSNLSSNCPSNGDCGTDHSILQPVLQWGSNHVSGGHYWQVEAMEINYNYNPPVFLESNPCYVQPGDDIIGVMIQTQINPVLWEVFVEDTTHSCYTDDFYEPGGGDPAYNTFQGGVLEGYSEQVDSVGSNNQLTGYSFPLSSCAELPATSGTIFGNDYDMFSLNLLSEAGPQWNSSNSVATDLTWQGFGYSFLGLSPGCNASVLGGSNATVVTWQN